LGSFVASATGDGAGGASVAGSGGIFCDVVGLSMTLIWSQITHDATAC
jgi:hypothetical protein